MPPSPQARPVHFLPGQPLDVVVLRVQSVLATAVITPFSMWRMAHDQHGLAALGLSAVACLVALAWLSYQSALFKRVSRWVMPAVVVAQMAVIAGMVALAGSETKMWTFPVLVSAFLLLRTREATAITLLGSATHAVLAYQQSGQARDTAIFFAACLLVVVFTHIFATRLQADNQKFRTRSLQDALTGIGNRRLLDDTLDELTAHPDDGDWSLIMLDIDHFKTINDRFGHHIGDACLKRVAHEVQSRLSPSDRLFRYGGEEFVVLTPTSGTVALTLAERIRLHISGSGLIRQTHVSLSGGVAQRLQGQSVRHWLARADHALYKAKETGRNKVLLAPETLPPSA